MKKLHSDKAPKALGPYSQAIVAGGLVFASGQVPIDPATGNFVEGGIKEQTKQSLTNVSNVLAEKGVMVVQSTSPYYATKAFWCINETIKSEGFNVKPYHLQVPAFGDWGFNMASRKELKEDLQFDVDTRYLSTDNVSALFKFGKDEIATKLGITEKR